MIPNRGLAPARRLIVRGKRYKRRPAPWKRKASLLAIVKNIKQLHSYTVMDPIHNFYIVMVQIHDFYIVMDPIHNFYNVMDPIHSFHNVMDQIHNFHSIMSWFKYITFILSWIQYITFVMSLILDDPVQVPVIPPGEKFESS
jgi:hypothetical protein